MALEHMPEAHPENDPMLQFEEEENASEDADEME